ncbi:hypothetical protein LCGC14_0980950 [marine sediment metagenome]|uniref:Uncharacterized protein n=1 Tax=marine sediment metagenome TaxID=412755 RepID=A0A0F9NV30_9ZZZZ
MGRLFPRVREDNRASVALIPYRSQYFQIYGFHQYNRISHGKKLHSNG